MRATFLLATLMAALVPLCSWAQNDTAHHRASYAAINQDLASYKRVTATWKDDPIVFELEGWLQGNALRKIIAIVPGEDGGGSEGDGAIHEGSWVSKDVSPTMRPPEKFRHFAMRTGRWVAACHPGAPLAPRRTRLPVLKPSAMLPDSRRDRRAVARMSQ